MVCGRGRISGLRREGRTLGGLGLQAQPDGSSVSNILEGSLTEDGIGAGKAIFEGGFKFAAFEARKKFNSTASADPGAIAEGSWSQQEVQK